MLVYCSIFIFVSVFWPFCYVTDSACSTQKNMDVEVTFCSGTNGAKIQLQHLMRSQYAQSYSNWWKTNNTSGPDKYECPRKVDQTVFKYVARYINVEGATQQERAAQEKNILNGSMQHRVVWLTCCGQPIKQIAWEGDQRAQLLDWLLQPAIGGGSMQNSVLPEIAMCLDSMCYPMDNVFNYIADLARASQFHDVATIIETLNQSYEGQAVVTALDEQCATCFEQVRLRQRCKIAANNSCRVSSLAEIGVFSRINTKGDLVIIAPRPILGYEDHEGSPMTCYLERTVILRNDMKDWWRTSTTKLLKHDAKKYNPAVKKYRTFMEPPFGRNNRLCMYGWYCRLVAVNKDATVAYLVDWSEKSVYSYDFMTNTKQILVDNCAFLAHPAFCDYKDTTNELLVASEKCPHRIINHRGIVINCSTKKIIRELSCGVHRTRYGGGGKDDMGVMNFAIHSNRIIRNSDFEGDQEKRLIRCLLPEAIKDNKRLLSVVSAEKHYVDMPPSAITCVAQHPRYPIAALEFAEGEWVRHRPLIGLWDLNAKKMIGFITPSDMDIYDFYLRPFFDSVGDLYILRMRRENNGLQFSGPFVEVLKYSVERDRTGGHFLSNEKVTLSSCTAKQTRYELGYGISVQHGAGFTAMIIGSQVMDNFFEMNIDVDLKVKFSEWIFNKVGRFVMSGGAS
jgi:hypothetical protein